MASIGLKLPKVGSSEQRRETRHSISSMVLFCYQIRTPPPEQLILMFKLG